MIPFRARSDRVLLKGQVSGPVKTAIVFLGPGGGAGVQKSNLNAPPKILMARRVEAKRPFDSVRKTVSSTSFRADF